MIEALKERVALLKSEHQAGVQQREALEQRLRDLDSTMLRISGAIQVLEELIASEQQAGDASGA